MKYLTYRNIFFYILAALQVALLTGCKDDLDAIVEEVQLGRLLSPNDVVARIRNQTTIELNWQLRDNVDSYVVEFSEDSLEFNTIIRTVSVLPEDLPIQETFFGDTRYSARVKAIADGENESNWTAVTIRTNPEQIFLPLPGINVQDTYATLIWAPGAEVTNFLIQPGNIYVPISSDESAAGEATIEGLNGATSYVATIYNGSKKRGTVNFSTLKQANVTPLDDLSAIIDAAADGATLVLASGTYTLGSKALTKSITIEGQKSYDMPIINGQLTCATTVSSISLKNIKFNGQSTYNQVFNATAVSCNVGTLIFDACEIYGYNNNIIYNNVLATYGDVTIRNSYIHDIPGTGGDGFDIRGGSFGSLTVENSTFANGIRTFLRMQVTSNVAFRNCTFYKICTRADDGNNRGFFRSDVGGSLEVSNCLFVETGLNNNGVLLGNWARAGSVNAVVMTDFDNNYYFNVIGLFEGQFTSPSQVDATEANPGFEDAPNGDFTITNQLLIDEEIGDPRWWF